MLIVVIVNLSSKARSIALSSDILMLGAFNAQKPVHTKTTDSTGYHTLSSACLVNT